MMGFELHLHPVYPDVQHRLSLISHCVLGNGRGPEFGLHHLALLCDAEATVHRPAQEERGGMMGLPQDIPSEREAFVTSEVEREKSEAEREE